MASAKMLDGKALAAELRSTVASDLQKLQGTTPGFQPQLSIVQVTVLFTPVQLADACAASVWCHYIEQVVQIKLDVHYIELYELNC